MSTESLLALDPGEVAVFIPIVAIFMGGLIAVASIFTKHQREMAEKFHKQQNQPELIDEIRAMRADLADLRDRVNQATLAIESRGGAPRQRSEPPDVPQRLTD